MRPLRRGARSLAAGTRISGIARRASPSEARTRRRCRAALWRGTARLQSAGRRRVREPDHVSLGGRLADARATLHSMPRDKSEPKQTLPKTGEEIPLPTRADVLRDLRKGARVRP